MSRAATISLCTGLLLAACARTPPPQLPPQLPPPAPVAPPTPAPAPAPTPAPPSALELPRAFLNHDAPADTGLAALDAFRAACTMLPRRTDRSGLTRPEDWAAPCAAARTTRDARDFFNTQFTAILLNRGRGFATGYFEPEIAASPVRAPGYQTPLYKRPPDLIDVDLGAFRDEWKGRTLRGRLTGTRLLPYPARAEIAAGALQGQGLELAWAADANAAFFLEIQGSGRLRLPDGRIMRIGYDGQNGRDYVAIGRVLKDQGKLSDPVSMQSILAWLAAHPDEAPAIRNANPSAVFFRELTELRPDQGPKGALGLPLTPGWTAAVDPAFTPYGTPMLIERPGQPPRIVIALDTGGAIRGAGRVDLFLGAGEAAAAEAGKLATPISIALLLPSAAAERLLANPAPAR